jgi:hypothetical protein
VITAARRAPAYWTGAPASVAHLWAVPHHHLRSRGAVGAIGLVEYVEFGHVLVGQGEVEDLSVLADSLALGRLGDDRNIVLKAPAQQHLCGCPPHALPDPAPRSWCRLALMKTSSSMP